VFAVFAALFVAFSVFLKGFLTADNMLTLLQTAMRIGVSPSPDQAMADLLAGRNYEANQAIASLFAGATAEMPDEYRARVAAIGREMASLALKQQGFEIEIGDQGNPIFWLDFKKKYPHVDILIDDGGHVTKMVIERGLSLATDMTKSGTVRWEVTVEGPRESASATANVKGEIVGVDISQTARAANWSAFKEETLKDAVPTIKQAFGTAPKMVEVDIYDKYVMFKAISPRDKEVTTYKYDYNGVTMSQLHSIVDSTPIEVRMSNKYKLEDFLFDIDSAKLEMAPALGQKAMERLGFTNGRVVLYSIKTEEDPFARKNNLKTQWTVSCQQGRKSGMVMYDLAGNETKALPPH